MGLPFALIMPFFFFFFILSNTKLFLRVSAKTSNDLISDVCKRTRTPTLCLHILKSNGRARKASSPLQLGEVSTDLSKSSAKATRNMILFSSLRTRDKGLKEQYKSCAANYDSALYYINIANHYLKGGDYASVGRYAAAALNEPISCRHNFASAEPADHEFNKLLSPLQQWETSWNNYIRYGTTSTTLHLNNIITYPKFIATASNDLINDICQKTKSPLCSKILKSDRRAHQATSIRVLGEVTLDMAMACTDSTAMLLRSLERTRNHQLREKFENCWVYYAFIYNYLEEAKDSFSSSDFGGVSKNVGAVLKELYSC
ncbi:UNVERIFIED_CONTAM: Pectinesterase inhibitor [Sesamum calycinum]|uniref:Pectinesterase inhibitor n=1 Tax=Sesamum calycinum TaxID=2727403 RepID=A0AAW2R8R3_9LAMI